MHTFMISEFKEQFTNQNASNRLDGAHKKFGPAAEAKGLVAARALEIFPLGKCGNNMDSDLASALEVMAVIIGKNTVKCTPEKSYTGGALPFELNT